jgi:tRNA threonylcarbamoyl adenosine modification protein (Sua5/YciO/YrdC/YwlC family)
MADMLHIHPRDPQQRLLSIAVNALEKGGVIVYPTDSSYALGCHIGDKRALERIRRIRRTEQDHDFTLVCADLAEIAVYARVNNWAYRLIRSLTPGPYTFVLPATHEVPKRLRDPKRRSIGIRVPNDRIAQALIAALGQPIMSSTLIMAGDDLPLTDPEEIRDRIGRLVDVIIDAGPGGIEPTSVLDLSEGSIRVVRRGKGDVSTYE